MTIVFRTHRQMQPRNSGSVNIARSAVDQTLPRAIRQYEAALAVNGFPIVFWRRKTAGLRCTCCGGADANGGIPPTIDVLESGITILDPQGAGTQNFLDSMLQGSVFSIDRYGSRKHAVDFNGGDNYQRTVPNSPLVNSKEIHNKSSDLDDSFAEQIEPEDAEDLFSLGTEHNMATATATMGCAVCLGTGWVGGYDPSNALRTVYDVQASWTGDILLDTTVQPRRWLLHDGGQARVPVLWPAGAVGVEALRVWNNKDLIHDVQLHVVTAQGTLAVDGNTVGELCTGEVRELILDFGAGVAAFTHLELQFEMGVVPVYAEWSRLAYNENLQLPENLDNPSITLSPSLPHVALYDLIGEEVYRKLWKINSSNPAFDRERQINGWEVTARLLQTYELPSLLPRRQSRVWYWGNRVPQQPRDANGEGVFNPYDANRATQQR
jgi:hypothetical protein